MTYKHVHEASQNTKLYTCGACGTRVHAMYWIDTHLELTLTLFYCSSLPFQPFCSRNLQKLNSRHTVHSVAKMSATKKRPVECIYIDCSESESDSENSQHKFKPLKKTKTKENMLEEGEEEDSDGDCVIIDNFSSSSSSSSPPGRHTLRPQLLQ